MTSADTQVADTAATQAAPKRTLQGVVTSCAGNKSATIMLERRIKHPVYGKFIKKTAKLKAHDEKNECSEGDIVKVMETRPLSKTKRWRLIEVIEKVK